MHFVYGNSYAYYLVPEAHKCLQMLFHGYADAMQSWAS